MAEEKVTKRELVRLAIEEGKYTKKQIAENLEMSVGSVSSQMTYLRWMGNNIIWNADKILSFCTEEEFTTWEAERGSKTGTKGAESKLSNDEKSVKLAKTIATQEKTLNNWIVKQTDAVEILNDEDSEENQDYVDECNANIVLTKIKVKRNKVKAESLPSPEDAATALAALASTDEATDDTTDDTTEAIDDAGEPISEDGLDTDPEIDAEGTDEELL